MWYGSLPSRSITIESNPLQIMEQEDVWSKRLIPVRLEIDGTQHAAHIRHRGGHTRLYPKKSYEVMLDNGVTLHWNAEYDDPSMLRNALSFRLFEMIGTPAPKTRHCLVEWNGQPLGVYLEIEAVDQAFFDKRDIECRSIHYAIHDSANFRAIDPVSRKRKRSWYDGYELQAGGKADRARLASFVRKLNLCQGRELRHLVLKRVNTDAYIRWLAGAVLTGNYDGFDQNYTLYEDRKSNRYGMIPWDYEGTWGRNCYGKPCDVELVRIQGYNLLTQRLLELPSCRKQYQNLLAELIETVFTERELEPLVRAMHDSIAPAIRDDVTRKWSHAAFEGEYTFIMDYIASRRSHIHTALKQWQRTRTGRQKTPMLK